MPTTAKFKENLRAYANRAIKPRRVDADHMPEESDLAIGAAEPFAAPDTHERFGASRGAGPGERSLHNLPNRGPVLDPEATALMIFPGITKRELPGKMKWVRENVPFKLILGHKTVGWFEADVRWWLEDRRNGIIESAPVQRAKRPARARAAAKPKGSTRTRRGGQATGGSRGTKRHAPR